MFWQSFKDEGGQGEPRANRLYRDLRPQLQDHWCRPSQSLQQVRQDWEGVSSFAKHFISETKTTETLRALTLSKGFKSLWAGRKYFLIQKLSSKRWMLWWMVRADAHVVLLFSILKLSPRPKRQKRWYQSKFWTWYRVKSIDKNFTIIRCVKIINRRWTAKKLTGSR